MLRNPPRELISALVRLRGVEEFSTYRKALEGELARMDVANRTLQDAALYRGQGASLMLQRQLALMDEAHEIMRKQTNPA
ncbi:MAG: hypothetical protein L0H83_03500 [Salinisphaera sp.]|nr:hypothetical protein [Salinisphaera sp.]